MAALEKALLGPDPLISVELRPPRIGLRARDSMDSWIDLHHSLRRLTRGGHPLFLTDDAVGDREEENLRHLTANLGQDADLSLAAPFLTCKHSLEYCLMYAQRAHSAGFGGVVVIGGDQNVGPPRCVPRSRDLRRLVRERVPELLLGGWSNPFRDPAEQVGWLGEERFGADFALTQVVSHHDLGPVERFLEEVERQKLEMPLVFGVFFYRSANRTTLDRLGEFFPVPTDDLMREFESGATAEEICARTVRAIQGLGVKKIYLANMGVRKVGPRLDSVLETVEAEGGVQGPVD